MNWFMSLLICGALLSCGPPPPPHPTTSVQVPLPPPPEPVREAPKPVPKPEIPKDLHTDAAEVQHSVNKAWADTVHYQMTLKRKLLKHDND